jgi:acetate kinase
VILVLNAGSSTLKFGLFDDALARLAGGTIEEAGDPHAALATVLGGLPAAPTRVGQRVVHGGTRHTRSVVVDPDVRAEIAALAELAPLHNPPALAAIDAVAAALPAVPQVAVFDTAYFATLPPRRFVYPVPYGWYADWGVRRFGFHGISHAWAAERAAAMLGRADLRVVSCHLGNGCSATASRGGVAVDTTMGFTPLDGLMMGTRPGALDPGILVHVQRRHGVDAETLDRLLNHGSGLLGVSGVASDFRAVEAAAAGGDPRARLALEIYADRVRGAIGALAVALGGVDALVFTAGVGENAAGLRAEICAGLACLGLAIDPARNAAARPDADVAAAGHILVVHAEEERMIARETARLT